MAKSRLHQLAERGQSVWIDFLSREFVQGGELRRMIDEDAVTGLTSNPSIFQSAIAKGGAYDDQLQAADRGRRTTRARSSSRSPSTTCATRATCCGRYGTRRNGEDGYVSLEVDPTLAHKTDETLDRVIVLHDLVDRPNVYIKIPATLEGLPAIEESIARGIAINITLIFSLDRYDAVVEAYLRGLERLVEGGGDPSKVASVASFFISRIDTEADKRLEAVGNTELQGKLGDRERAARLQALPGGVLRSALGSARGEGRPRAAAPLGLDVDQESLPTATRSTSRYSARTP